MNITQFIYELRGIADSDEKYIYFERYASDIIESILNIEDESDRLVVIDKIINSFSSNRHKGLVKRFIENNISAKQKQEIKTKLNEFSGVKMMDLDSSKSGILPTTRNFELILLAAKRVKLIYDNMTGKIFFSQIDWPIISPQTFVLTLMNGDHKETYHPYDETNKARLMTVLNTYAFPAEKQWASLDDAVLLVAQTNKTDLYERWMRSAPQWDGIDRFGKYNCWAVKYLGMPDEDWTYAFARLMILCIVWRCLDPGHHIRYYFSIEGEEDLGKTKFCSTLLPSHWYISSGISVMADNPLEFYRYTSGRPIVELAEGGNIHKRTDNDLWKRVSTEISNTYRGLYKDDVIDRPKRNVYIMTVNPEKYVNLSTTSETRLIACRSLNKENEFFNLDGFANDKEQIFAQAISMFDEGIEPWLTKEEMPLQRTENQKRDVFDDSMPYQIVVEYMYIDSNRLRVESDGVTLTDIYAYASGTGHNIQRNNITQREFGKALVKYGLVSIGNQYDKTTKESPRKWALPDSEYFHTVKKR